MEKQNKIVVKLATDQKGIKRLHDIPQNFEQLVQTVRERTKQPDAGLDELKITYEDGSDQIAISNDGDLQAAYEWASSQPKNTIKLFVGDRANFRKSRSPDVKKAEKEPRKQRAFSKKEQRKLQIAAFDPQNVTDGQEFATKQPRQRKEKAPIDQATFAKQMQELGENMAKWGNELTQEGADFDPKTMKKQVGYHMRQMFNGKTPEDKPFKAKRERKEKFEKEDGGLPNKQQAIVISKPKDALVGKAGSVLEANVTFLNASKQAYDQGYHVVSCEGNENLFEDIKLPIEQVQPNGRADVKIPIKIKSTAEACETVAKFGMTDDKGEPVGIKAVIKVRIEQ